MEIKTKNHGCAVIVDDDVRDLIREHSWYCISKKGSCYVRRYTYEDKKARTIYLHRQVMGFPEGLVDHANGNPLDNRRANLRMCRYAQNAQNRRNGKRCDHGFRGIHRNKHYGWIGAIVANGERHWSKTMKTPEEAARAYDDLAIKYHGEFAVLNFPISSVARIREGK